MLLRGLLAPPPGASLLDVGCGTGYFTRRFALDGAVATGLDPDPAMIAFARSHTAGTETFMTGDATRLPFADGAFDYCTAITSLCFIQEQRAALLEMLRVTRKRLALGLLNRRSLLFLAKGRRGGRGAYRGAYWHTASEIANLLKDLGATRVRVRSAIFLPSGGPLGRIVEQAMTPNLLFGGFLAAACDVPEAS